MNLCANPPRGGDARQGKAVVSVTGEAGSRALSVVVGGSRALVCDDCENVADFNGRNGTGDQLPPFPGVAEIDQAQTDTLAIAVIEDCGDDAYLLAVVRAMRLRSRGHNDEANFWERVAARITEIQDAESP